VETTMAVPDTAPGPDQEEQVKGGHREVFRLDHSVRHPAQLFSW